MPTYQKIACLFPGQGAQYPGIGKDLYDQEEFAVVRDTYAEASEALGYDIAKLSFDTDAEKINLTRYTQPVLLTHSIACLRVFQQQIKNTPRQICLAAGHSLGEYSALVCAESLDFSQALKLVKQRGELMGKYGQGEMEALMIGQEDAAALAGQHHCGVAACNLPEQTVVGGSADDLDALVSELAIQFPRKRSARLKTEGAFHTYYMIEAALKFRETLAKVEFKPPRFQVLSNFTGDFHAENIDTLRSYLFLQLFNPVLWHKNLTRAMSSEVDALVEFGGGLGKGDTPDTKRPNLEGMVKKVGQNVESPPDYFSVINSKSLEQTVAAFSG